MWILWMTSSLSSHSTSASVSELSRLVTHTAVSSPKYNSEKRPLSNSVAFRTLFKWHRYCGILKFHIVRKINTGIRYEPVYRPALAATLDYVPAHHGASTYIMSMVAAPLLPWHHRKRATNKHTKEHIDGMVFFILGMWMFLTAIERSMRMLGIYPQQQRLWWWQCHRL